jgi:WD40 repeat protein
LGAGFFANPTHTEFQYRFLFPNRRVASVELYLSNTKGTGPGQSVNFLGNGTNGLHTFEGATLILQVSGGLSVERDAASSVSIDRVRVVRDIQAFVDASPSGGSIAVVVKADGNPIATLRVPDGAVQSVSFVPAGTLALAEGSKVNIDIASVPQGTNTFSGKNLSLQIRT